VTPGARPAAALGASPVRRGTDGLPLSGVAQGLPAVQRSVAAPAAALTPAPTTPARTLGPAPVRAAGRTPTPVQKKAVGAAAPVVPLAAVLPAATVALPVQRAPSTPSLASRLTKFLSPQRPAEPQTTFATAERTSGSNSGGSGLPPGNPPPVRQAGADDPPPAYSLFDPLGGSPGGNRDGAEFDARALSDGQVDELTHRLIGPLTRLLRTELRLDRERIGRLRDTRR
jgi:hypothetical protein